MTIHFIADQIEDPTSHVVIDHFDQLRVLNNDLLTLAIPLIAHNRDRFAVSRSVLNITQYRVQLYFTIMYSVSIWLVVAFAYIHFQWIKSTVFHQLRDCIRILFIQINQEAQLFFAEETIVLQQLEKFQIWLQCSHLLVVVRTHLHQGDGFFSRLNLHLFAVGRERSQYLLILSFIIRFFFWGWFSFFLSFLFRSLGFLTRILFLGRFILTFRRDFLACRLVVAFRFGFTSRLFFFLIFFLRGSG